MATKNYWPFAPEGEEEDSDVLVETEEGRPFRLLVLNDDVNSFQSVIIALVEVLGMEFTQADQCANIVHNNGKCSVKEADSRKKLIPYRDALTERHLTAKIEGDDDV